MSLGTPEPDTIAPNSSPGYTPLFIGRGFVGFLHDLEYVAGMIIFAFLAFISVVVGPLICIHLLTHHGQYGPTAGQWTFLAIYPFVAVLSSWSAVLVCRGAESTTGDPRSVKVALQIPRGPAPFRPLLATWWVINAICLLLLANSLLEHFAAGNAGPKHSFDTPLGTTFRLAVIFAIANAVQICILFAISTLYRNERLITLAHKYRVVIDLALVALATMLPVFKL